MDVKIRKEFIMQDIFEELFYAFEDTTRLNAPESDKSDEAERRLWNRLSKKDKRLFDNYKDTKVKLDELYAIRDFRQGFFLG